MNTNKRQPIDYTNKDYASLREAMLDLARVKLEAWTDHSPNDLGVVLLELFAYMGDILLYYQDRIANESYLLTAVERRSVLNLLRLIGYELRPPKPASADLTLIFENVPEATVVIERGTEFITGAGSTSEPISFRYVRDDLKIDLEKLDTIKQGDETFRKFETLPVLQVDSVSTDEIIGSSDGTAGQRFALPGTPLIEHTLVLRVNVDGKPTFWEQKKSLVYSLSDDQHYVITRDENDVAWIEFGDNKYGKIPPRGRNNLIASYLVGGGEKGNVPPNTITQCSGEIDKLKGVFNKRAASGGAEHEDLAIAAKRAPQLFRAMNRAVTAQDHEAHALEFGVGKVRARAASWNRIELFVAPMGGGYPSDTFKEDLRQYFEDKRIMTSIIDIMDPKYVKVRIEGTLNVEPYFYDEEICQQAGNAIRDLLAFENVDFQFTLYISKLYEAIEAIEGVASVHIKRLQRWDQTQEQATLPEDGKLDFEWSEIPIARPVSWKWLPDVGAWKWETER